MQDEPTPTELIKAVADFLRDEVAPQMAGHAAYKLRVSINALDLVTRQLMLEPASDAVEAARLSALLGVQGSLAELNRVLAERIANGEFDLQTPGSRRSSLADHVCQARGRSAEHASYKRELGREVVKMQGPQAGRYRTLTPAFHVLPPIYFPAISADVFPRTLAPR